MSTVEASVTVDVILDALDGLLELYAIDSYGKLPRSLSADIEVEIDLEDAAESAGYLKSGDAIDEALEDIQPLTRDLRDAVEYLASGDRRMASIMFGRALEEWPTAQRAVEEALRPRRVTNGQSSLLAA